MLFSSLYENNVKSMMYCRLDWIFNPMNSMETHILMLRCFHTIKVKLSIDDRITCNCYCVGYYRETIKFRNYQQIIDYCVKLFYEIYSPDDIDYISSQRLKIYEPYISHISKEINTYIEDTKSNKIFIIKLLTYEQLDYFAKTNNPKHGIFTYLRFL